MRGASYANNTFYNRTVSIPKSTYTYPTNAKLRFRCDASDNNDDVYIDEIVWRGLSGSGAVMDKADQLAAAPQLYQLLQNHPNPFNPRTTIEFSLPTSERVLLRVFDLRGRQVDLLADGVFAAGRHEVVWAPQGIASGVYYYKLQAGSYEETRRMTLMK